MPFWKTLTAVSGGHGELVSRIRNYTEESGKELTFENFLNSYHLTPADIYSKNITFARLCVEAGAREDFREEIEAALSKIMYRFTVFDSRRWIRFLLDVLPNLANTDFAALLPLEQRMMQMFYMTVWDSYAEDWNSDEVLERLYSLAESPVLLAELQELLRYQYNHIFYRFHDRSGLRLSAGCTLHLHPAPVVGRPGL